MSLSILEWWDIIQTHYGDLDRFEDARTVRIMRQECINWIADDVAMVALLQGHPEEIALWDAQQTATRGQVTNVLKACSAWLGKRGLVE